MLNKSEIAKKLEETLKAKLKKKVSVESFLVHDTLSICIDRALPASRSDFIIIREEALKNGYDVEEDIDQKSVTETDVDIPDEMYLYFLRPHSDSKSK